jgi:5-bromo-4-chloroindolyl phosphate hydrolysis protein
MTSIVSQNVENFYTLTSLTLILLMRNIGWAPNIDSKWQEGFNSAFKELGKQLLYKKSGWTELTYRLIRTQLNITRKKFLNFRCNLPSGKEVDF